MIAHLAENTSGEPRSGGGSAPRTLRCGLIGTHIGASRLARALAIMCADHGLTLDFTPIDTAGSEAFDFEETVDMLRLDGWTGVTVTHPWKTHAADWAGDALIADIRTLGAANTLTFAPVAGHNTDYSGFLSAWAQRTDAAPGRVAVAGAGGVARAVVPALIALGADSVLVWDRDARTAERLAADTGATAIPAATAADAILAADGLVNCTPMGMGTNGGTAFDPDLIGPQGWAFDAVYTPTETPFLQAARRGGLDVMTGFDLFRFMAMKSFQAYTGIAPDPATTLPKLDQLQPR
ncbi:shikimate dehydrogenase [Jannaschia sp. S6380]|uniref:shikimate dehydrogenase family protein n=1 Tax=Jannaschia sp. S6380 TaxID=2926408 RepID=UPI001FF39294|nr:shikimate dehydrogenase [Jannaschia sp. S6380]MCK0166279.1 shikimate dehydrogenase [Jannaschia sp. S6380]